MKRPPHFTLELLRGGPPHNQLVSPITEYLALCGDAAPFTLRLPFEHRDLNRSLQTLRYVSGIGGEAEPQRQAELERVAHQLGMLLGSIPAFAAEMSSIEPPTNGEVVHLRLVLAGNELSLVPWEIAQVPDGLPGAGLSLLLQPRVPISMTREVRGASRRQFQWDRKPRVLFAAADQGDFPQNTVEAHLLALRRALESWTYQEWWTNGWQRTPYPIDIIEQASIDDIRRKCLENDYTHVHILAHGCLIGTCDEARFGLYLHQSENRALRQEVTGVQLAHALMPSRSHKGASDPVMVILATCDSANQVGVVNPGGSVAHTLHQMGVPWVIASQFPLTVTGSVILAEDFYNELFQGTDPRMATLGVRQHLTTRFGDRHDWATLVAYASFPPDFDIQVGRFRQRAMKEKWNRAYALVDVAVLQFICLGEKEQQMLEQMETVELKEVSGILMEVLTAIELEEATTGQVDGEASSRYIRADYWARRAATRKRLAEIRFLQLGFAGRGVWMEILLQVYEDYKIGLQQRIQVDHWILVQYFVLQSVIGKFKLAKPTVEREGRREEILWKQAFQSVEFELESKDSTDRMWAHASKVDLLMIALAENMEIPETKQSVKPEDVLAELKKMVSESQYELTCPAIWPTFRQFWRWHKWWGKPAKESRKAKEAAELCYHYLWDLVKKRLRQADNAKDEASKQDVGSQTADDYASEFQSGIEKPIKVLTNVKLQKAEKKSKKSSDDGEPSPEA